MLFNSVERWGFNINLYDVPDLEAFLRAALMLPRSLTADSTFQLGNTTAAARAKSGPITITDCVPSTFAGRKWTPEARTPDLPERGCSVKVLIVNEKYPPYISGGAERSVQILAEELPTGRPPLK